MNVQALAKVFGIAFVLIGLLGFVPGITTESGLLLGLFAVNPILNMIHIVSGSLALWAKGSASRSGLYFKIFGVLYALMAILGLVSGSALGLVPVNTATSLLHLVIAAIALHAGFISSKAAAAPIEDPMAAPAMPEHDHTPGGVM